MNTANTIVKRDASGNFSAGAITAISLSGSMSATNLTTGTVPLARLSGITSNQWDAGTWQYIASIAYAAAYAAVYAPTGMVLIPGGSFTMGDTLDGDTNAAPVTADVSPFYMDTNLVTWSKWQGVYAYATNRGYGFVHAGAGKAANHPVQMVDWYDCVKWCNARSQQAGKVPVYYTDAGLTKVYTNLEVTVYVFWR